jgi:hypothetical protein
MFAALEYFQRWVCRILFYAGIDPRLSELGFCVWIPFSGSAGPFPACRDPWIGSFAVGLLVLDHYLVLLESWMQFVVTPFWHSFVG